MNIIRSFTTAIVLAVTSLSANSAVVSGTVTDIAGNPLAAVPVSDGIDIVLTAPDGTYSLETNKHNGYVFITVPSGYEPVKTQGNRPQFWHQLTAQRRFDEKADFVLRPVNDSKYILLTFADIQLAKHFNDVNHYNQVMLPDINATIDSCRRQGYDVMALTLGDQTFDRYWYVTGYALPESCADMEKINCPIYNVIGNHDHDPYMTDDHKAAAAWRRIMGPNYYSFNRGGIHYIILDNVYYINEGASFGHVGRRNNEPRLTSAQFDWLQRDLQLLTNSTTPIVVAMHIPLMHQPRDYGKASVMRLQNAPRLLDLLSRFTNVRVFSGHSHRNIAAETPDGRIRETTFGSVCGDLWSLNARCSGPNKNMCSDGSPAGYGVWTVSNGRLSDYYYKSHGHSADYQFRAYDLNNVLIPDEKYAAEYSEPNRRNEVLINVWAYTPGCKVEVTENGRQLDVRQVYYPDPLYIEMNGIPRIRAAEKRYKFPAKSPHMFLTRASAPDTPLVITFTDTFGNVYTRTMERPKPYVPDMD